MRTSNISLTSLFGFLALMMTIYSYSGHASVKTISCSTTFSEKQFNITNEGISFSKENDQKRDIASVQKVVTHKKHLGFTKILYLNGLKHKISIKDANSFSEASDYLSITSPKGHEMTYPLECHKA